MSGGFYPQPVPMPRGLRPVDAPHIYVEAPKFLMTGTLYLVYCVLISVTLVLYSLFAVLAGLLMSLVASILGPLALLGGIGMLIAACAIMTYCVFAVRKAFNGNLTGVLMALSHILVSTLLICAFYVIQPLDYIPPASPPPPGSIPKAAPPPKPATGTQILIRMFALILHFGPLASAAWDVRRSMRYRRLESLGSRLTLRDLMDAGLVRAPDEVDGEPDAASISNAPGRPHAYGARREEKR